MGVTDPLSPHVGKRRWDAGSVPEAMFPRAGAGSAAGKVPASPVPGNGRLGLSRDGTGGAAPAAEEKAGG